MKFVTKSVLMLGTAALMAVNSRASVLIDQFGTNQNLSTTGTALSNVNGADILGSQRFASLTGHTGATADSLNVNLTPNELDFNNGSGSSSNLSIIYDGTTNTDGAIHFGMNSDITEGGLSSLFFFVFNSDHAVHVIFNIYSGSDNTHASTLDNLVTSDSTDHTVITPLSSFVATGGAGGADFTHVSAITLSVAGVTGLDLALKQNISVLSPVPEPASLALTGAGLLGFGFIARKRRK